MACIIMKESYGDEYAREIRTDVEYIEEQYLGFAVVPPELVNGIIDTKGYCDIELSEDGKTVVSFTARANPHIIKFQPVAYRNVVAGEYITVDGVLYKATANIPNGEPIIVGQNAVATTVEEQLYEMTKGE